MSAPEPGCGATGSPEPDRCRYQPRVCALRGCEVWAITTQRRDGTWRAVNCLDKDEGCFSLGCCFTTDGGAWPFELEPLPKPSVPAPGV